MLCRLQSQISQKFQPCDMEAVLLACLTLSSDSEREKSPLHQLGIVFCARFATKACVEPHHSLFVGIRASKAAPPRAASSCWVGASFPSRQLRGGPYHKRNRWGKFLTLQFNVNLLLRVRAICTEVPISCYRSEIQSRGAMSFLWFYLVQALGCVRTSISRIYIFTCSHISYFSFDSATIRRLLLAEMVCG